MLSLFCEPILSDLGKHQCKGYSHATPFWFPQIFQRRREPCGTPSFGGYKNLSAVPGSNAHEKHQSDPTQRDTTTNDHRQPHDNVTIALTSE